MGRSLKSWKKVLYEKQDYPDNYFDPEQFLNGLRKNLFTKTYELRELVMASGVIAQEVSSVCIFVSMFWFLEEDLLSPVQLLLFTCLAAAILLCGWLSIELTTSTPPHQELLSRVSLLAVHTVLLTVWLCGTAPILKTLTATISTDTIWTMTAGMLIGHLVFHNYFGTSGALTSEVFSLNAAVFAAVCLASRLPSSLHAFVTVVCAVVLFVVLPEFRRHLQEACPRGVSMLTGLVTVLSIWFLLSISLVALLFYLLSVCVIIVICPLWLVHLQRLKNNIHGPWDEASIKF